MNRAYPKSWFDRMGLVSLLDTHRHFQSVSSNRRMPNGTSGVVWEDGRSNPASYQIARSIGTARENQSRIFAYVVLRNSSDESRSAL